MAHHHMTRGDWLRLGAVLIVTFGALYLVYPFWPLGDVVNLGLDLQGGVRMVLEAEGVDPSNLSETDRENLDRAEAIINTRTDQYGLANVSVSRYGPNRILVTVPGADNPEEVRRLVGTTAVLEFRRVIDKGDSPLDQLVPRSSREIQMDDRDGVPYLLSEEVLLKGDGITNATVRTGGSLASAGSFSVELTFNREGAETFADILIDLGAGELLAIVLDNTVYSAPVIQESIVTTARNQGWRGVQEGTSITNITELQEAEILSVVLKAGALPMALTPVSEETVGPTLGDDSIRRGMMTIVIGFILILVYMFGFYRGLGVVANLALILNMLIVFAALVLFGAVLTLPGIAGIILTIGMTVDANVIIFERIKEERRAGKSPLAAVRSGYEKSLSTLMDANITTLITALILLLLGTGPIRGFAITLGIGVIGSLFCALVASRMLLEKAGFDRLIPVKAGQAEA